MTYSFEDFELDLAKRELRRLGAATPIHLEPQVFSLLAYLVEHRERVVSKNELIDVVWEGRIVSESALTSRVKSARRALDDDGRSQRLIKNVPGHGYRFSGEVADTSPGDEQAVAAIVEPSVALLPLDCFGHDESLRPLADGLVENLTTVLTRVPFLRVTSRLSAFAHKRGELDAQAIGRSLGVRYLVEGSVAPGGDSIRVNVQLIDATDGHHLWARAFDGPGGPEAPSAFVGEIAPELESRLVRSVHDDLRATSRPLTGLENLLLASTNLAVHGWHRNTFEESAELIRHSIALEPDRAMAHAYLALLLALGHLVGLLDDSEAVEAEVVAEAERALDLDRLDSYVASRAGCALADIGQTERALPILRRALELDPQNGHAWTALGTALSRIDDFEPAIEALRRGIEMSPSDRRLGLWRSALALTHLRRGDPTRGDLDHALAAAEAGCQSDDKLYLPWVLLTSTRLARGERDAAIRSLRECLRVKPDLSTREVEYLVGPDHADELERLRDALRTDASA